MNYSINPKSGEGDGSVSVTVTRNPSLSDSVGSVTVTGAHSGSKTVNLRQTMSPSEICTISIGYSKNTSIHRIDWTVSSNVSVPSDVTISGTVHCYNTRGTGDSFDQSFSISSGSSDSGSFTLPSIDITDYVCTIRDVDDSDQLSMSENKRYVIRVQV